MTRTAAFIRSEIARLRAEVWAARTLEQQNAGVWPAGLDYVKMVEIEELYEELDRIQARAAR
jgi:hypothetical protein